MGTLNNRFVYLQLLKDEKLNNYDDNDLKKAVMKIRGEDLKIKIHIENLSNEFDHFLDDNSDELLTQCYLSLTPAQRLQLVDKFHYEEYEKGQRKFDIIFGGINLVLWIFSLFCIIFMVKSGGNNPLFNNSPENISFLVIFWFSWILVFIWYFFRYIYQNDYLFDNTKHRREAVNGKIETIKNQKPIQ